MIKLILPVRHVPEGWTVTSQHGGMEYVVLRHHNATATLDGAYCKRIVDMDYPVAVEREPAELLQLLQKIVNEKNG